jgi:hypothetical protein
MVASHVSMSLPDIWQRYLERNIGTTPQQPRGTLITQRGEILLDTEKWAPFTAEQTFEAQRCGFVWHARVKMAPLVTAVVEDAYEGGHGRLEVKLFGLFRIMRAEPGLALDRGELTRYLGELPWNPTAIVHNPEIHFTIAPSGLARVWAHDEASYIDCRFDAEGDLVEIETTTRVRGDKGRSVVGPPGRPKHLLARTHRELHLAVSPASSAAASASSNRARSPMRAR